MPHSPIFRALPLRKLLSIILVSYFIADNCFAIVDVPPTYSIVPSTNGLNLAYFAKQDKVKIALYIINHESFAVVCDAKYQGGPDTKNTHEQTLNAGKAIQFSFAYPKETDHVVIQFVCIKPVSAETEHASAPDNAESPDTETQNPAPITETDLSIPRL